MSFYYLKCYTFAYYFINDVAFRICVKVENLKYLASFVQWEVLSLSDAFCCPKYDCRNCSVALIKWTYT